LSSKTRGYKSVHAEGNPYERLASAIIVQASVDYRSSLKKSKCDPSNCDAKIQVEEVEKFFLSSWFGALTTLNGEQVMIRIKNEIM